jgi:hypothetical protein
MNGDHFMNPFRNLRSSGLLALAFALLGGCSSSQALNGRVVESPSGGMEFVSVEDGDPALIIGYGVAGARIEVIRDPQSMNRSVVARGTSGPDGIFSIPIDAFGAGWMVEDWLYRCTHPNYQMVELFASMPGQGSTQVLQVNIGSSSPRGSGGRQIDEAERIRRELDRYGG